MKPIMADNKPHKVRCTKCASSRSSDHGGIRKPKRDSYIAARRSNRGDAGIRGHDMIGQYRTEITSSQGKRCGVFSLEISTTKQLAGGLTLTPKVFDKLFRGDTSRAWHVKKGWNGPDYEKEFHDEQLGLILYLWGREQGKVLQLGVAADGMDPFVLPLPELEGEKSKPEDRATRETVWIHNDNAMLIMGRLCNHYSGITILGPFDM